MSYIYWCRGPQVAWCAAGLTPLLRPQLPSDTGVEQFIGVRKWREAQMIFVDAATQVPPVVLNLHPLVLVNS